MLGKPAVREENGPYVMDDGTQASIGVTGGKTARRVGRMPQGASEGVRPGLRAEGEQNRHEGWEDERAPLPS